MRFTTCTSCGVARLMENYDNGSEVCRFCVEDPAYGPRIRAGNHSIRTRAQARKYTNAERARRRQESRTPESRERNRIYAGVRQRVIADLALRESAWVSEETHRRIARGET